MCDEATKFYDTYEFVKDQCSFLYCFFNKSSYDIAMELVIICDFWMNPQRIQ